LIPPLAIRSRTPNWPVNCAAEGTRVSAAKAHALRVIYKRVGFVECESVKINCGRLMIRQRQDIYRILVLATLLATAAQQSVGSCRIVSN